MARRPFLALFGADPALDHLHPYETSWLLPPVLLGALRAIIAVYVFFCLIYIFCYYGTHDGDHYLIGQTFSYFTYLNFWGMAFYFAVAAFHSFAYAATGRSVMFEKLPRVFRGLHALFYSCITTFPFLVLIVYWGVLYPGTWFKTWFEAWSNVSEHGLIGLYALLELFLATTPTHPLINLAFLILILALYLSLAYLTHKTEGFYAYSFLDPGTHGQHSGKVAAYCFTILAAIIVIFLVTWVCIWLRQRLTGGRIKRARRDRTLIYSSNNNGNYNAQPDFITKGPNEF
ncbi:hypothetical protein UA08_05109 [Talaromyces atroroseus]|uniref:FAR-17a/AIG1-like protein n=1 Tax=Talaromyces atroroseus TaxID=1441469 RepID=A0A225AX59_TALAT|nr:hypothetical protein UA08_05109 [Talaromyces atroroseus]OKL59566.1 hypothetical protein UA08_05109 [Talaromyces atroroseus]